jgi:DNA-binding transcriptional LysR family regulator
MSKINKSMETGLNELAAFVVVAEHRSFTRAASQLGVSQSALSHTIRELEARLGLQLLARTTRSVAPTAAGANLLKELMPALEQIEGAISEARKSRDRPSGRVRLVISRAALAIVLQPKLKEFVFKYPEISLDVVTVSGPVDLVSGQFDAGIQLGEYIQRDMIAVRVTKDLRLAIVGSPAYFDAHEIPISPRDLRDHQCINVRSIGGPYRWEFQKGRKVLNINVTGPLVTDNPHMLIQATLDGLGLGLAFEEMISEDLTKHRLIRVLDDWTPQFPGFFMFYPSRRNQPAALTALIETLRVH